jgi:hypothetical protein
VHPCHLALAVLSAGHFSRPDGPTNLNTYRIYSKKRVGRWIHFGAPCGKAWLDCLFKMDMASIRFMRGVLFLLSRVIELSV